MGIRQREADCERSSHCCKEKMKTILAIVATLVIFELAMANPMPKGRGRKGKQDGEAKADGAFFTHNEKKEEANPDRTEGEYRVWLPDGRLMIVSYYVDKDSGFVPTITYEEGYTPEW